MSKINTKKYIERFVKIRTKTGVVDYLKLNKPQNKYYNAICEQYKQGKPGRIIILKARQMGFSTLTEAIIFKSTATEENVNSVVVSHNAESTNSVFKMAKLMYDHLPLVLQPAIRNNNAKTLYFADKNGGGLNSSIRCLTAGSEAIGRGETIQYAHITEYAFWGADKEEQLGGLLQTIPNTRDSLVVIESTANGFDDFRKRWYDAVNGLSDFVPVFCAWWEMEEYRINTTLTEGDLDGYERKIKELYNLDFEQLAWRRWCLKNNCNNDINLFKQEYPSCPEEAFISTGLNVFDKERIIEQIAVAPEPVKQGKFECKIGYGNDGVIKIDNIKFVEKENGIIKIFEEPKKGFPYVLGGDTAGDCLGDFFTCYGIDNITSKQVCSLKQQSDEDEYSVQMYCLGMYYNAALIGIENNFSSYPNKFLQKANYPKLYVEQRLDSFTGAVSKRYGFRTTCANRNYILAELKRLARDNPELFADIWILKEMLVFVKNEQGKEEAMSGEHDDMIMASAICYQAREQQGYTVDSNEKENINKKIMSNFKQEDEGADFYDIW